MGSWNPGLSSIPVRGSLSISIPGMIMDLYETWMRFGLMEWNTWLGQSGY
ncbi:MAG: hypothetical protein DRJ59_06615 [Thermoprotei archaeon]|nr:MAG: hypothetical protein DRJ59_06615 [Thermoprotei archaeon]